MSAQDLKGVIAREPGLLQACMQAMQIHSDSQPLQYVLTLLFDVLREDSSAFKLFADALQNKIDFWKPFTALLKNRSVDPYVADKAAYLLTSLMSHSPAYFSADDVSEVCGIVCGVG